MNPAIRNKYSDATSAKRQTVRDYFLSSQSKHFQSVLVSWCLLLALVASVMIWSHGWHAGFLTAQAGSALFPPWFWEALNTLGDERMLLALMLPFCMRNPRVFWAIVVASILGALFTKGLKLAWSMPRPAEVLDLMQLSILGERRTGHSFPSSHATSLLAFAMVCVAYLRLPVAIPILGLAVLASYSRVAAGAHWPVDVMAGALIGSLAAGVGVVLARYAAWGCYPKVHWALVCIVAFTVCSLPFDSQGFPETLLFRCALCGLGLIAFWRHYLQPLICQGWTVVSIQPQQI
jgi:membrane-associated phospholipid phosphatase